MDEAPNRIMKLLKKLDDLIEEMGRSLRAMEENRSPGRPAARPAKPGGVQPLVISLLTEAQMAGGGGGGSGNPMPSMSEQLKQMAQEQAGLNGATEELRRMLANRGMSQEMRSQMKSLGEEQAGLAGKMGELAEEERQRNGPRANGCSGTWVSWAGTWNRSAEELEDGLVSEETLIRQERILSRMLDARNSVRRRDYTTRRESRTATRLFDRTGRAATAPDDEDPSTSLSVCATSPWKRRPWSIAIWCGATSPPWIPCGASMTIFLPIRTSGGKGTCHERFLRRRPRLALLFLAARCPGQRPRIAAGPRASTGSQGPAGNPTGT